MHIYSRISQICKARGVNRVFYFHTDHFEPWAKTTSEMAAERLAEFARQTRALPYAQRLTLFYLPHVGYAINEQDSSKDIVEFVTRSPEEQQLVTAALDTVKRAARHSFELHLHHEQFTYNDSDFGEPHRTIKQNTTPQKDLERWSRLIDMGKAYFEADLALPLESWAFIHGNWALNGSDHDICQIKDEISLLLQKNAWGDFSFPAGRGHCDPDIKWPHTVVPCSELKGYILPAALPRLIGIDAEAFSPDRFFIWSSKTPYDASSSLDTYWPPNVDALANWEKVLLDWFELCPVIENTLLIKTHAHSMANHYYESDPPCIPHAHPYVRTLFTHLNAACELNGVALQYGAVSDLRDLLVRADRACAPNTDAQASVEQQKHILIEQSRRRFEEAAIRTSAELAAVNASRFQSLGSYYVDRFSANKLVTKRDQHILRYYVQHCADATFCEIGSGIGELPVMIGLCGLPAYGIEPDDNRRALACTIADAFSSASTGEYICPTFIRGELPKTLSDIVMNQLPHKRLVACLSNISGSVLVEQEEASLRSLWLFDEVIIDIARFAKSRTSVEQDTLLQQLSTRFDVQEVILKESDVNLLHLTARRPAEQTQSQPTTPAASISPSSPSALSPWAANGRVLVFAVLRVALTDLFPRLAFRQARTNAFIVAGLTIEITDLANGNTSIQTIEKNTSWVRFDAPGLYQIKSIVGMANVAIVSSPALCESEMLAIATLVSMRIRHSCGHEWLLRPDLSDSAYRDFSTVLAHLFYGELPLQLQCDNAADVACAVLSRAGFSTRLVSIRSEQEGGGHFVMEVYLPDKPGWVMLDCDFGIAIRDTHGQLLSVDEIGTLPDVSTVQYVLLGRKQWLPDNINVDDHFTGLMGVHSGDQSSTPTIADRSYDKIMANHYLYPHYYEYVGQHECASITPIEASITPSVVIGSVDEIEQEVALMQASLTSLFSTYIDEIGGEASGAQQYYSRRKELGKFLSDDEMDIFRYVIRHWDRTRPIFDMGGGFGQLAAALGWFGYRCRVLEPDVQRLGAIWYVSNSLAAMPISKNFTFLAPIPTACAFPQDVPDSLWTEAPSALAICLNLISSNIDTEKFLRALKPCKEVIFCPGRFGVNHDDVFEQEAIVAAAARTLDKRIHLLARHGHLGYWRLH